MLLISRYVSKDFTSSLNDKLKEKYEQVVYERRKIFVISFVVSFFLTYLFDKFHKENSHIPIIECSNTLIFVILQYFIYNLYPKKYNMFDFILDDKNLMKEWIKVYKQMNYDWNVGILSGLIGYILLVYLK
tara:strand:+ start:95 stop:487 length:393 start_codon:yes stop_codon:yes gene_type:complete